MKRVLALVFILTITFSTTKIVAQSDHLEPANSIFNIMDYEFEYYSQVRNILFKDLDDNPEFRFLVMPSFSPENVLNIEFNREEDKYFIIFHIGSESIWYSENKEKIKVTERKKEISKKSVELIKELYKSAINKTAFIEKDYAGLDGNTYYFSINDLTGITWSPSEGTKMAELVLIGNELIKLTEGKESIIDINANLEQRITDLMKKLK